MATGETDRESSAEYKRLRQVSYELSVDALKESYHSLKSQRAPKISMLPIHSIAACYR